MSDKAQLRAQAKYDKANTKQIVLKLNITSDADILEKLENAGNKQGYIKALVRGDIKSSDVLEIEAIRLLILPAAKKYNFSKVYLFGSYARGEADIDSDVDLLVEGGNVRTIDDYDSLSTTLQSALGKKVDIVMKSAIAQDESRSGKRFAEYLRKESILLYEKSK